jgi:hypothetical protein
LSPSRRRFDPTTRDLIAQLRQRALDVISRALDAARTATGSSGAALVASLEAAEATAGPAAAAAATAAAGAAAGAEAEAGAGGMGAMEVDARPLGAALEGALRGVVDHEPAAALKAAAAALLKRLA